MAILPPCNASLRCSRPTEGYRCCSQIPALKDPVLLLLGFEVEIKEENQKCLDFSARRPPNPGKEEGLPENKGNPDPNEDR